MLVLWYSEYWVGVGVDNVKQGGGGDYVDYYFGDDVSGCDVVKEDDCFVDEDYQC